MRGPGPLRVGTAGLRFGLRGGGSEVEGLTFGDWTTGLRFGVGEAESEATKGRRASCGLLREQSRAPLPGVG